MASKRKNHYETRVKADGDLMRERRREFRFEVRMNPADEIYSGEAGLADWIDGLIKRRTWRQVVVTALLKEKNGNNGGDIAAQYPILKQLASDAALEVANARHEVNELQIEVDRLRAENASLKKENDRLQEKQESAGTGEIMKKLEFIQWMLDSGTVTAAPAKAAAPKPANGEVVRNEIVANAFMNFDD